MFSVVRDTTMSRKRDSTHDAVFGAEGSADSCLLDMNGFIILAIRMLRILPRSCAVGFLPSAAGRDSAVDASPSLGPSIF